MWFFLACKPWIIGAVLCSCCFGESGSPASPVIAARQSALLSSAGDFFRIHPQTTARAVTVSESIRNIQKDQKEIWTSPFRLRKSDLRWMVPLAATAGLFVATDRHSASLIHSNESNRRLSSNFADGGLVAFGGIAASSFAMGAFIRNEHARETGILTGEALANSFLVSEALKFVSQRDRPDMSASRGQFWSRPGVSSSFPSQHAAMAWAAAAVIAREYPGPVTTWGAYGLASAVSLSRLTSAQHFPSDVLIGAVAGYLIGRHIYNAHHDDRMTDRTGSTPVAYAETSATRSGAAHSDPDSAAGSVYVPLDSWVYPALRRLAALGYIPDQTSGSAPWTRLECLHQVQEAEDIAGRRDTRMDPALNEEALRLISDLDREFSNDAEGGNLARVDSVYTRTTQVAGAPLRDSYHFGQTVANDLGRPYGQGLNNITGVSAYAVSGRFSAYVRGEYQYAPGADAYSSEVQNFIARADNNPVQGSVPVSAISRFQPLEMYVGAQLGFENITFGKQSLWWGPGQDSAFSFSSNAAPFYMLRFAQTRPIVLPGPFSLLGKIRTEIVFGKLSGHQWPARPYMNAQKISLALTDNLEVGFTRSAFFGGVGHPLTFGSFKDSLFGTTSIDGPAHNTAAAGDRHSGFDFRWRLPGLRRYVTLYSDSFADDDPNPLDNPRRSAWGPGIYFTQIPGLHKLDLRVETYSTWLYRKDYGGAFVYYNNQYHDSYTNQGNLLGSWVGRDSRAYVATTSYWLSARSRVEAQYRQIKAGGKFLPGGGTQTDASLAAQWSLSPEWLITARVQHERYYVPILGSPQHDTLGSLQVTFTPRDWAWRW